MAKKNRKPQKRTRQKPTTGQLEFADVCYLGKIKDAEGKYQVKGYCTCDKWESSDEATTITKVGLEAKVHCEASNGKCKLRQHDPDPDTLTPEQIAEARERLQKIEDEANEAEKRNEELMKEANSE